MNNSDIGAFVLVSTISAVVVAGAVLLVNAIIEAIEEAIETRINTNEEKDQFTKEEA